MNIVISGTVGVGKTTISKKLNEHFQEAGKNSCLIKEIEGHELILDLYYKKREKWSFVIQIDFVLSRFKNVFRHGSEKNTINIFDRHFLDDYIFASMPMIKDDIFSLTWKAYKTLNMELSTLLKEKSKIDYFFLLKTDFDTIFKRISNRGEEYEKFVDINYWKNIYGQYYDSPEIRNYIENSVQKFIIVDATGSDTDKIVETIVSHINNG